MEKITFLNPHFFWLLLAIPAIIYGFYKFNKRLDNSLILSQTNSFSNKKSFIQNLKKLFFYSKVLALILLIFALSRPRIIKSIESLKNTSGVEIVMAIDVSASMLAQDLKPNRLKALKEVATNFVTNRTNDRIGIVVYAAESYTKAPVTSDKIVVQNALQTIENDLQYLKPGTAIGIGLGTAINRLKDSKAKSKIIILLTDGVNSSQSINPKTVASIAQENNIKVYTIGVGTNGRALSPDFVTYSGEIIYKMQNVEIDETLLKEIANVTKGKYFRATDNAKLKQIYSEIDALEKTDFKEKKYTNYLELYRPLVVFAMLLLILEFILKNTIFKGFI